MNLYDRLLSACFLEVPSIELNDELRDLLCEISDTRESNDNRMIRLPDLGTASLAFLQHAVEDFGFLLHGSSLEFSTLNPRQSACSKGPPLIHATGDPLIAALYALQLWCRLSWIDPAGKRHPFRFHSFQSITRKKRQRYAFSSCHENARNEFDHGYGWIYLLPGHHFQLNKGRPYHLSRGRLCTSHYIATTPVQPVASIRLCSRDLSLLDNTSVYRPRESFWLSILNYQSRIGRSFWNVNRGDKLTASAKALPSRRAG